MNCVELEKARSVYANGGNVSEFLRSELGVEAGCGEVIEVAYDLQAGTYIDNVNADRQRVSSYAAELRTHLDPWLTQGSSLLDIGTGELTTLALMFEQAGTRPADVHGLDISWSRLHKGLGFWRDTVKGSRPRLHPVVGDIGKLPLATSSIDVITSSHALEPNGGRLPDLLRELFRVCRQMLVLFEPCYELNCDEGRARMDRLGYIKGLQTTAESLGARVLDIRPISNASNPLNPTSCFIIEPPQCEIRPDTSAVCGYTVPGTDYGLVRRDGFWMSEQTGLVFPELHGIPVLKEKAAILASGLFD